MMKFILITNNIELAEFAASCGVQRIFVDLERLGKLERQGHLDTLISQHSIEDAEKIRQALPEIELIVRLNPLHSASADEVEAAIAAGADFLMLPMFRTVEEVRAFSTLVAGRTGIIPLVETTQAATDIGAIAAVEGVTEIYIGLNDLHLDMKLSFMFEPVANGMLDRMVKEIKAVGKPFGFGGIARVGEGMVPGELVLAEHIRLGSQSVILSRTLHRKSSDISSFKANLDLKAELEKLRAQEAALMQATPDVIREMHARFQAGVDVIVASKRLC